MNMNAINNEIILNSMKRVMEKNNIEVLFITETLGTEDREKEIRQVFNQYDVMYRGRKRLKGKKYAGRGGIICIAKKGTVKVESPSKQDDLMNVTWNGTYVACDKHGNLKWYQKHRTVNIRPPRQRGKKCSRLYRCKYTCLIKYLTLHMSTAVNNWKLITNSCTLM